MAVGFDISGSLGVVKPDKGMTRNAKPVVHLAKFGDGYEQRLANGLNPLTETFSVSFNNRTKEDIDDIIDFFESKGGVTKFNFIIPNSNEGSSEETIKVVCDTWKKTFNFGDYYSATATFRRVYEA